MVIDAVNKRKENAMLEKIRAKAQHAANREQKPFVILNMNRHRPLYVVREYRDGAEGWREYVETVYPEN